MKGPRQRVQWAVLAHAVQHKSKSAQKCAAMPRTAYRASAYACYGHANALSCVLSTTVPRGMTVYLQTLVSTTNAHTQTHTNRWTGTALLAFLLAKLTPAL